MYGSCLIIDDDPDDVMMIQRALNNAEADYAHSVTDAFRQLEKQRYDLLLVDVCLPDSEDVDHIREIRSAFPEIPIVVVTNSAQEGLAERCLNLGAQEFLTKDVLSPESLAQWRLSDQKNEARPRSTQTAEEIRRQLRKIEAENQQLVMLTKMDELTSLPNRKHFSDILHQNLRIAERRNKCLGVLYFDLNDFKRINDNFGHTTGDIVLVQFAARLRSILRRADFLARLGGDEFAVVTDLLDDPSQSYSVAKKIKKATDKPFRVDGREINISVSVGIATFPELKTADELLQCADVAMFEAKRKRRHFACFYTERLQTGMAERRELEKALKTTLENEGLRAEFQHIVAAKEGVLALEVFCRWRHPSHGYIQPSVFIPIAEAANCIGEVNRHMLKLVAKAEQACFAVNAEFFSINLSSRQLEHDDVAEQMFDMVQQLGLRPERICFEIEEHHFEPSYKEVLTDLKNLGFRLAMSNYGSGPTSIEQLAILPLDYIKLGHKLTRYLANSEEAERLCGTIIRLAHALGVKVIAEQVENRTQKKILTGLGCDHFQGKLIAAPFSMPL